MRRDLQILLLAALLSLLTGAALRLAAPFPQLALARCSTGYAYAADAPSPCPRPAAGAEATPASSIYSQHGILRLTLHYNTIVSGGRTLYCFQTPDGVESPTLHVSPGDEVAITLVNSLPQASPMANMKIAADAACGDTAMTASSVNIHFHGMNISPTCHADEVIRTVVNPGESFNYAFKIPSDEPPGLYWYHPHIHGISTGAVQGGASGAIVVDGIQAVQPAVAGLPQRILVIRGQSVPGTVYHDEPNEDLSVNYVPVSYPSYTPAVIPIAPNQREFWRVLNASADTVLNLRLFYDGQAQPLEIVALDGVPTGSQNGSRQGKIVTVQNIEMPPAGRAEFIINGPPAAVGRAVLVTSMIDTGPAGDNDPPRPLAQLVPTANATQADGDMAAMPAAIARQRFEGLATAPVTATRRLYFSEVLVGPGGGDGQTNFYITVDGQTPTLYSPTNPPAITTHQGAVEDWTIENRSQENHEFHLHQTHFMLLGRDGKPVDPDQRQMLDTVQVPFWTGQGRYPSVTVRIDFRGPVIGDFVYHCHILDHEDRGMMAIIRVLPK